MEELIRMLEMLRLDEYSVGYVDPTPEEVESERLANRRANDMLDKCIAYVRDYFNQDQEDSPWIKCNDKLPELTNAEWFSDMVLVAFKSAETDSDEIQYRVDDLMLDRYHKAAKLVWNRQKMKRGYAETYLAWKPFGKYTEGE